MIHPWSTVAEALHALRRYLTGHKYRPQVQNPFAHPHFSAGRTREITWRRIRQSAGIVHPKYAAHLLAQLPPQSSPNLLLE